MMSWPINELSIAANSTNPNLLSGSTIEFLGKAATVTLYGGADAIGLTHTFFAGQGPDAPNLVPPNGGLSALSTPGAVKVNETFLGQWALPAGSRLVHSVTNPTGAPVKVNFLYVVQ